MNIILQLIKKVLIYTPWWRGTARMQCLAQELNTVTVGPLQHVQYAYQCAYCFRKMLFQVASRSLSETCGSDIKVQFLSNAPIAVMKKYKNTSNKVGLIKVLLIVPTNFPFLKENQRTINQRINLINQSNQPINQSISLINQSINQSI